MTFDVFGDVYIGNAYNSWVSLHEIMAVCKRCHLPSIFNARLKEVKERDNYLSNNLISQYAGVINDHFEIGRPITNRDTASFSPPEHVPEVIENVFREGASSVAAECYNAAGAMFRLCLDLSTKSLLPNEGEEVQGKPDKRQRRELAARLEWLFDSSILPVDLKDLAACVREHGNDGAHDGTLTKVDAEDLLDFTVAMLERIFTEPERVKAARARRAERHKSPNPDAAKLGLSR